MAAFLFVQNFLHTKAEWIFFSVVVLIALLVVVAALVVVVKTGKQRRSMERNPLTGLYNREAFFHHTKRAILRHPSQDYVIVRTEIDRFSVFNDTFGSKVGRQLLRRGGEVARRYRKDAEGFPIFGYYEADHFMSCWNTENFDPDAFYDRVIRELEKIFPNYFFSLSMGIAQVSDPWVDISVYCDRAYVARKTLDEDCDHHWAYFDQAMQRTLREEGELALRMQNALKNGEFIPFFQPQIDHSTGALSGTEALVRWKNAAGDLIPPDSFVPPFEKNGFIYNMDKAIWRQACAYIRQWKDEGLPVPPISVNLSRRDIYHTDLVSTLISLIREFRLQPSDLHLEVTESSYMENPTLLGDTLRELTDAGFFVEMDDFGSGYSSLTALKNLPFRLVKLDMGFLRSGLDRDRDTRLLRSVIHLAHDIDLPVVAEGVETREQADSLLRMGCRYMQGYYFAKPMPAENYRDFLQARMSPENHHNSD